MTGAAAPGAWLRAGLFNLLFFGWALGLTLSLWPLIPAPRIGWMIRLWARGVIWLLARVVGLRHEIRGRERVPDGPVLIAARHQSAWDTAIFFLLLDDPAYVLKRELLAIPIVGWYLRRAGMIAVDRRGGMAALKAMLAAAEHRAAAGRPIVIFPEGTRTAPGERHAHQPGVAALYGRLGIPVVPVALNSGLYWGRRSFVKRPGTILLEFLPPIAPGLDRRAFSAELSRRLEVATARLEAEAAGEAPAGRVGRPACG